LAFWPPGEAHWYAVFSAFEICYPSPVRTQLAYEWRSEKIGRQLDALDGLGEPAAHLDQLYAELAGRPTADYAAS